VCGRARPQGHVGIPGRVDHALGQDGLAASLRFDDDTGDRVAVHQGRDEHAVQRHPLVAMGGTLWLRADGFKLCDTWRQERGLPMLEMQHC